MVVTNGEQAHKLAEIGAKLREGRQTKALSLEQITSATLIPERHLRAIEEGDISVLPEPIYIQGFIRKYGSAVGLEDLAEQFPLAAEAEVLLQPPVKSTELRPFHLYAIYVLMVVGAVSLLAAVFDPMRRAVPPKPNLAPAAELPVEAPTPPSERLPAVPPQGISLELTATDMAWLQVTVDGEVAFEGMLAAGESRTWQAQNQLSFVVGNAGAVRAKRNGEELPPLGAPGEVVELNFTADSTPTSP
ncbi:MAG: helix-turn-helix domain-containing protein [Pseudanabaenaceae cyanobacterium]